MSIRPKIYLPFLLLLIAAAPVYSQDNPPDPPSGFEKSEQMIPMRDGVKLHTIIYTPKSHREPLPILFQRTPYGIDNTYRAFPSGILKEVIDDGYIFAFQDIRGRFKSDGQFVMLRPLRTSQDPKAIDEGTDTYDTIEWMVKNLPNNNG
jgi:putative CocE/NonD family hydrolase